MTLYLAAAFESLERMRGLREWFHQNTRHQIVGTWLDEVGGSVTPDPAQWIVYAIRDLQELKTADGLVLDTFDTNTRGGREVEWGISLARMGLRMRVLVGPIRNVFHTLAQYHFETWDAAKEWFLNGASGSFHDRRS